ncbi:hypothetical protein SAMN05216232_2737 [Virgibacillus subterraneus]|uniref:Swarming motility protein SwrB n=1 Tax=Virgibacillus subterraneus TaxID=621109 RepID=A0A1H9H5G5_9BACI|nr:helix-turn-helix domain-containing protein [Virgibacillus subterraneus]SEQ57468.1 hypothetical protein SAMN05216232_2737 [Virgibacillus subterraneus]
MTSMLLIISFLLHLVALVAIFQLFKQLQLLKKDSSQDIMELLETYLEEIKEENRFLEEEIGKTNSETVAPSSIEFEAEQKEENVPEYIPESAKVVDDSETSMQAKILQLYDQGLKVEDIARRLNCGKTEAELIIKLHGK